MQSSVLAVFRRWIRWLPLSLLLATPVLVYYL
jgi:hypothetical protein